jgi:hypothetical protein
MADMEAGSAKTIVARRTQGPGQQAMDFVTPDVLLARE